MYYLKNKQQSTYEKSFYILNTLNVNLNTQPIIMNLEFAAINAIKNTYYSVIIRFCQFPLGQSILRKTKEYGISCDFLNNSTTKRYVRALIDLSYVQRDFVRQIFSDLVESSNFSPHFAGFMNIFTERI